MNKKPAKQHPTTLSIEPLLETSKENAIELTEEELKKVSGGKYFLSS